MNLSVRHFLKCESGVSEIIAAVLLLAIAVSAIAIVQTEKVPEWNKAVELEHSNTVYDDFLMMKSNIEDSALFHFSRSSVIHMGAHYPDRLIFINPADTSGTITTERNAWVNISFTTSNGTPISYNLTSDRMTFMPNYNYFPDNPSLVYEHGIVIKDYGSKNYVYTDTDQSFFSNDTVNIIIFDYPEESLSSSAMNTISAHPESTNSTRNNTNVRVSVYTNYPQLWGALLNRSSFNNITHNMSGNNININYLGSVNVNINIYNVSGSVVSGVGVYTTVTATGTATPTPAPNLTYVFDFLNITGNVMNFDAAKSDSDGGAFAIFNEALIAGVSENNYTNVTSNTTANGTITNFVNMQNADDGGASATLTESVTFSGAATSNATASLINTSLDNTTGNSLADLQSKDSSSYEVKNKKRMFIDEFNTTGMSGSVSAVKLWVKYKVDEDYTGTNQIRWSRDGGALNNTGIQPIADQDVTNSSNLYDQGINTLADISTLNIEFQNTDTGSHEVKFDYVWIQVNYSGTTYSMNITTNTTSVPLDTNYYLEINYSHDANETGYGVYVFNGTGWTFKGNLTSGTWNLSNFTLNSSEVINGNVSVRYIDMTPAGINKGNLSIDYQRIHGITTPYVYHLNITTNTTSVPVRTHHYLQINYSIDANDTYSVYVWNGSAWNLKGNLDSPAWAVFNATIGSSEVISGNVSVRYLDMNASAAQQGTIYLDYQRIYSTD